MRWRLLLVSILFVGSVASCSESASGPDAASTTSPDPDPALAADQLLHLSPVDDDNPDGAWELVQVVDGVESVVPTPEGGDVDAPDVNADGTAVVYTVERDGRSGIWSTRLDASATAPTELIAATDLACPRWFPGSERVVLVSEDGRLEILDAPTGETAVARRPTADMVSCADPVDDRHVVFGLGAQHEIPDLRLLDLESGEERRLGSVPDGCIINHPAVSPDSTTVAVDAVCEDPGDNGLWLIPAAGGPASPVLRENEPGAAHEDSVQYWIPQWTTDGSAIVYHRSGSALASIHVVNADGTNDHELVPAISCCPTVGQP